MRSFRLLPMVLAALPLLAGCETVSETLGFSTRAGLIDPGPGCPRVGLLPAATRQTVYRPGPGRDLTDIVVDVEVSGLSGACLPDKKGREVGVELNVHFNASRGPADQARVADFVYLVAVVDEAGKVLARREFPTHVDFPAGQNRLSFRDELAEKIPLGGKVAGAYQVLVGLKMDRDQLNRARQRGQ